MSSASASVPFAMVYVGGLKDIILLMSIVLTEGDVSKTESSDDSLGAEVAPADENCTNLSIDGKVLAVSKDHVGIEK